MSEIVNLKTGRSKYRLVKRQEIPELHTTGGNAPGVCGAVSFQSLISSCGLPCRRWVDPPKAKKEGTGSSSANRFNQVGICNFGRKVAHLSATVGGVSMSLLLPPPYLKGRGCVGLMTRHGGKGGKT